MRYLLLLITSATILRAQPGPAVGATIPPFSLKDQNGKKQTFRSITGPKGAVLVFYRSADW